MASRRSKSRQKRKNKRSPLKPPTSSARGTRATDQNDAREDSALQLKPRPWSDERLEDVAVFSKEARVKLPEPARAQAEEVSEALEQVARGEFSEAAARLKGIPRSSPLAEWRLFVRGLISFYQTEIEAARESWLRLNPARRPARIAATLLRAEEHPPLETEVSDPPSHLVEAAAMLRLRKDAIAAAERIAATRHRDPERTFSPSQLSMLNVFLSRYQRVDPEFCRRFSQACVQVATCQPDPGLFEMLIQPVAGPVHDPHWNLLASQYWAFFQGGEDRSEEFLEVYLTDLESLDLPKAQRDALASLIYFWEAEKEYQQASRFPFPFMLDDPEAQYDEVDRWLKLSLHKYPANRQAHLLRLKYLEEQCEGAKPTDSVKRPLIRAKAQFVDQFPDEIDASLWLIDQYFDGDELSRAESLIQKLEGRRISDPRAKALPWKLRLREAMRLARRKSDLHLAHQSLDAAESLWPKWLSRDWLPFLRAAVELRAGSQTAFGALDQEARKALGRADWVADYYTFSALQQMQVPSAGLKPFRTKLDHHAKACGSYPLDECLQLGSFFWDLTRTGLRHKAYRMQAPKLGKVLCERLESEASSHEPGSAFYDTCCWIASHNFWLPSPFARHEPDWAERAANQSAQVAASVLEWVIGVRFPGPKIHESRSWIASLENAAQSEKDVFYRHRFEEIAQQAGQLLREWEQRYQRAEPAFGSMFPDDMDDPDDMDYSDDMDDPDDVDEEFEEEWETEPADDEDFSELVSDAPPKVAAILRKLGEEGLEHLNALGNELMMLMEAVGPDNEKILESSLDEIFEVFRRRGIPAEDMMAVLEYLQSPRTGKDGQDPDQGPERQASFGGGHSGGKEHSTFVEEAANGASESSPDDAPRGEKVSAAERRRRQREKKRNRRGV